MLDQCDPLNAGTVDKRDSLHRTIAQILRDEIATGAHLLGSMFTGRPMPCDVASRLDQAVGAPALLFTRRYLDAVSEVMVCSFNWHPADRLVYRMRLQRE